MSEDNLLRQRDGESLLQYHKRIIYGKLVDKTLSDIDYTELAELVYGQAYSSDVARRMFYGSRRTLELLDKETVYNCSSDEVFSDIDKKLMELQKERRKYSDQRRELIKVLSYEARHEHMISELVRAADNLSESVGVLYSDKDSSVSDRSENEAVLVFSDWHYGMVADNIYNKYNTDICKERIGIVTKLAIDRIKLHKCRCLNIVILGDLLHGAIHTGARVASEELVCDQLMQVSEILAQTICELSRYVPVTNVYSTYGNHARTVQNKNDSIHRDNMERIVGWWLKHRLAGNDNISVHDESENEFILLSSNHSGICATHGDNDLVKTSPRLLHTLFHKKYGVDIEYILLGDKHHSESFEELGITSILCGSLCGADDYANGKRLYSTPSQELLIFNDDGLDARYNLKCS